MTNKEFEKHQKCQTAYAIHYLTQNGEGDIVIKTSLYEKYLKKFQKAFKDCLIIKMEEIYYVEQEI